MDIKGPGCSKAICLLDLGKNQPVWIDMISTFAPLYLLKKFVIEAS